MNKPSRRNFLKGAAAGSFVVLTSKKTAAKEFLLSADPEPQATATGDKVRFATIGVGGQGMSDTRTALQTGMAELVAVADIYDGRRERAQEIWGSHIFTTRDYREILTRKDVDAVIIGTPDHWHAQIAVDALNAGKDVYCEKPIVQMLPDGHKVINAEKQTGKILQVGSQRVSSIVFAKAKELLASGAIGTLNMVEAWINRRSNNAAWQYSIPPDARPDRIDWDRFLGNAPKVPFEPIRLFRWRNYRAYGTGIGGDLFIHLFSGLHFMVGSNGPSRVLGTGGLRFWKDGRDVPDVLLGLCDYSETKTHPGFNVSLRVNFVDGSVDPNAFEESGYRLVGSDGVISLGSRGLTLTRKQRSKEPGYNIDTFPKAVQEEFVKAYRQQYPPQPPSISQSSDEIYNAPSGYSDGLDHFRNFFKAVRSRNPVVEDATFGVRAAGPALLTNQSYFENRIMNWDPEKMKLTDDGGR
ncbi:MAG: Gfo/Idh/MocA family oxidoreductase [Acidobacteriota bacterium]